MSRISPDVIAELDERCAGYCELCGRPLGSAGDISNGPERHHRHARGRGGAANRKPWIDLACNLETVHARCHRRIHAQPRRSRELFHILTWGTDPRTAPAPVLLCAAEGVKP